MNEQEHFMYPHWSSRISLFKQENPSVIPKQILFVGSSLMEQFPTAAFQELVGPSPIIYNRGVSGYRTENLLLHMEDCIFDLDPAKIFINIGTNDMNDPEPDAVDSLISRYDSILCQIMERLPQAELYLMAYYPVNYDAASEDMKKCLLNRTNAKISEANLRMQELARKYGLRYIDVNDNLKDENGNLKAEYTIEGMHIYEKGYRAIFDDLKQYI